MQGKEEGSRLQRGRRKAHGVPSQRYLPPLDNQEPTTTAKTSKAKPHHLTISIYRTQLPLTKTTTTRFHLPFHTTDH
jgi:hypothetical protein